MLSNPNTPIIPIIPITSTTTTGSRNTNYTYLDYHPIFSYHLRRSQILKQNFTEKTSPSYTHNPSLYFSTCHSLIPLIPNCTIHKPTNLHISIIVYYMTTIIQPTYYQLNFNVLSHISNYTNFLILPSLDQQLVHCNTTIYLNFNKF